MNAFQLVIWILIVILTIIGFIAEVYKEERKWMEAFSHFVYVFAIIASLFVTSIT